MSTLRNSQLYVSHTVQRGCQTAATLLGLASADDYAEMVLSAALLTIPELQERQKAISSAIKREVEAWQAKHPPASPTPAQAAQRAIKEAQS